MHVENAKAPLLTIFVSCYNEAAEIEQTLDMLRKVIGELGYDYEVLIYDDASSDNSVQVINNYIERHGLKEHFYLTALPANKGQAVNYFAAAEKGCGVYFYKVNGGNAHPPDSIKKVLALLGQADIIVPYFRTRLLNTKYNRDHRTFSRRLVCLTFAWLVRLLSGHDLHYFNGGVLHRRENVVNNLVVTSGFGYQAELLCRILQDPKIDYLEVLQHNYDHGTASTAFRLRNIISVAGSLLRIFMGRFHRRQRGANHEV